MTVIVHGPQGCGKTRHKAEFKRAFRCTSVVDDWNSADPLPADALALTNEEPPFAGKVTVFSYAEACSRAGIRLL